MHQQNSTEKTIKWIQLGIAVGLAFVGGVIQLSSNNTTEILILENDVERGNPIKKEDFVTFAIDKQLVPANAILPRDFSVNEGSFYKRSEKKGAVALADLMIATQENQTLQFGKNEKPIRIQIPAGVNPEGINVGSRISLQISTSLPLKGVGNNSFVSTTMNDEQVRLIECGEFRVLSVGAKIDRYDDQWESIDGAKFLRIAVEQNSKYLPILESTVVTSGKHRSKVEDIYTRAK